MSDAAGSESAFSNDELVSAYADLRSRCLELGRSLTEEQAALMSPCCPEWSIKDLFAHMAGVPVDILEGNVEGAATVEWADAHITRRTDDSLAEICDEWEATAEKIDELVGAVGTKLPPQFYIDAWTHEWDIRQAIGDSAAAAPDLRLVSHTRAFLTKAYVERAGSAPDVALLLSITDGDEVHEIALGDGPSHPTVEMSLFEMGRIAMGRRSEAQIRGLGAAADPGVLVFWTPNTEDIVDPVLS